MRQRWDRGEKDARYKQSVAATDDTGDGTSIRLLGDCPDKYPLPFKGTVRTPTIALGH